MKIDMRKNYIINGTALACLVSFISKKDTDLVEEIFVRCVCEES